MACCLCLNALSGAESYNLNEHITVDDQSNQLLEIIEKYLQVEVSRSQQYLFKDLSYIRFS